MRLIRYLDQVPKPAEEPSQPLVVRAQLANVLFGQGEDAFVTCSGKGLDVGTARDGALGEALERYASLTWMPTITRNGTRAELPGRSLDPYELVLYAPEDAERFIARYHDQLPLDFGCRARDRWSPAMRCGCRSRRSPCTAASGRTTNCCSSRPERLRGRAGHDLRHRTGGAGGG